MTEQEALIKSLAEKVQAFAILSADLYRLKIIHKSAEVVSSLVARLAVLLFFTIFSLIINIAIALYLGEILGAYYQGFILVGGFYGAVGVVVYVFRNKWIKAPLNRLIIKEALK